MEITSDMILENVYKHYKKIEPDFQKLITSGNRYSDWLNKRLLTNYQILINGIVSTPGSSNHNLEFVTKNIYQEFKGRASVRSLPYPFDSVVTMTAIVES